MTEEELRSRAEKIARDKIGFQVHFGVYIAVNVFLVAILYFTVTPHGSVFPWFIFPLFEWGIGTVAHFLAPTGERLSCQPCLRKDIRS